MKKIDDYYGGEMHNGREDYYLAFCRAQEDSENTCIVFNGGTYYFSQSIEIIRTLKLIGSGASYLTNTSMNIDSATKKGLATGTVLEFPPGIYGIILHSTTSYYNKINDLVNGWMDVKDKRNFELIDPNKLGGDAITQHLFKVTVTDSVDSIIQDLMIKSTGEFPELVNEDQSLEDLYLNMPDGAFSSNKLISPFRVKNQNAQPNGITMLRKAHLQNVVVYGFAGNGIFIHGFVSRETEKTEANTDFWSLQNVGCYANFNDGLRVFGSDAHFGIANKVQCLGNLGWGIADLTYTGGNTFLNCHCEGDNIKGNYFRPIEIIDEKYGDFIVPCVGPSLFMNCYNEGERSYINSRNIIINSVLGGPGITKSTFNNVQAGFEVGTQFTAISVKDEYFKSTELVNIDGVMQPKAVIQQNTITPYSFVKSVLCSNVNSDVAFSTKNHDVNTLMGDHPYFDRYLEELQINPEAGVTFLYDEVAKILTRKKPDPGQPNGFLVEVVLDGNTLLPEHHPLNDNTEILLKYYNHFWQFNTTHANEESPLKISSKANNDIGDEQLWLEKGFYLGIKANRVNINAQPTKPTHTAVIGDVVYNKNPIAGDADQGYAGWIFCNDETWHPFGAIVL